MQQNAENSVGVLTMASVGRRGGARVLVSPTDDMGKILGSLHEASIAGKLNLVEGVQVAQLALKHRRNKNGGQRIVLFVGSPVEADAKTLVKTGKALKKNNIAVDIVLLGSDEETANKLRQLVDAAKSNDNSNLVQVPPGVVPSDVLISSPVIQPEGSSSSTAGLTGAAEQSAAATFGGVDANLDPELAMALRVSMEEERARQQAAANEAKQQVEGHGDVSTASAAASEPPQGEIPGIDDEDALLQQALAMSMREHAASTEAVHTTSQEVSRPVTSEEPPAPPPSSVDMQVTEDDNDDDDDETMQRALQMSMQSPQDKPSANGPQEQEAAPAASTPAFHDANFVNQVLSQLPGVDPNDPVIKAALNSIRGGQQSGADAPAPAPEDRSDDPDAK